MTDAYVAIPFKSMSLDSHFGFWVANSSKMIFLAISVDNLRLKSHWQELHKKSHNGTVGLMLLHWSTFSHPCINVSSYDLSGEGCASWVTRLCKTIMTAPICLPRQHTNYRLTFLCAIDIIIYIMNHGVSSYYIFWPIQNYCIVKTV